MEMIKIVGNVSTDAFEKWLVNEEEGENNK